MGKTTSIHALLAVVFVLLASCEKETIGVSTPMESSFTINATVESGMLSFKTVADFENAVQLLSTASDERILQLIGDFDFPSYWNEFSEIQRRVELAEPESFQEVLSKDESERYFELDGELIPKFSIRPIALLVNTDLKVKVNGAIHYFSDKFHALVPESKAEQLESVIIAPDSPNSQDVFITFQGEENQLKGIDDPFANHSKLENCPRSSVAHQMEGNGERFRVT